jgi:hypothetical protein
MMDIAGALLEVVRVTLNIIILISIHGHRPLVVTVDTILETQTFRLLAFDVWFRATTFDDRSRVLG